LLTGGIQKSKGEARWRNVLPQNSGVGIGPAWKGGKKGAVSRRPLGTIKKALTVNTKKRGGRVRTGQKKVGKASFTWQKGSEGEKRIFAKGRIIRRKTLILQGEVKKEEKGDEV